jgi:hypothetical protein
MVTKIKESLHYYLVTRNIERSFKIFKPSLRHNFYIISSIETEEIFVS